MIRRVNWLMNSRGRISLMRGDSALGAFERKCFEPQPFRQIFVQVRAFLSTRLNGSQHLACRVDGFQDQRYKGRIQFPLAIAQLAEQSLSLMGDLFQSRECEETTGALDGVDRAENACQTTGVIWAYLQLDQILIQAREILMAFDHKLTNDILIILHALVLHGARRVRCLFCGASQLHPSSTQSGS